MKHVASYLPVVVTGAVLTGLAVLLAIGRLEYCGQPEALRPPICTAAFAETPTPAPPQKVVFLHIQTDEPDIEVSWAEN